MQWKFFFIFAIYMEEWSCSWLYKDVYIWMENSIQNILVTVETRTVSRIALRSKKGQNMLCCLQVCSAESRKLSDLFLFLMVLDVTVSMSTAPDNMLASGLHSSFLPSLTGIKSPRNMFVDAHFHKRNNSGSSTDAIHSDFITSSSYHIQSRSPTERAEQ